MQHIRHCKLLIVLIGKSKRVMQSNRSKTGAGVVSSRRNGNPRRTLFDTGALIYAGVPHFASRSSIPVALQGSLFSFLVPTITATSTCRCCSGCRCRGNRGVAVPAAAGGCRGGLNVCRRAGVSANPHTHTRIDSFATLNLSGCKLLHRIQPVGTLTSCALWT
jgi:hypothetical protein